MSVLCPVFRESWSVTGSPSLVPCLSCVIHPSQPHRGAVSSLQVKSWVVALDAESPLKTFKQGGSSEARHQGLRRAVALPGRVDRTGVGIRSVVASCLWPAGVWVPMCVVA